MKTKPRNKARNVKLRAKKYLKYQAPLVILLMALFIFNSAFASSENIFINEIQISAGKGKTNDDYIELYNSSAKPIKIGGWKIRKRTQSGTESSIKVFSDAAIIPSRGYFLWANSGIANKIGADEFTGSYISDNNSIALLDGDDKIVDQVTWGVGHVKPFIEGLAIDASKFVKDLAQIVERKNLQDSGNNSDDFRIILAGSPTSSGCLMDSKKCQIIEDPKEIKVFSDKIQINEILSNPSVGDEEFIELYNGGAKGEDLFGWTLHDGSKTGEYTFKDHLIIESKKFLVILKSIFGFALNNSGSESVILRDANGEVVSQVDYSGSKAGISYSFSGDSWHWTKFVTAGKENIFEAAATGTIEISDEVYVDVYADFAVEGLSENAKVTWDFGDGHKSYMPKTRHKYEKTGKYEASVKFSDGSEDIIKNFTVEVIEIDHPKVKIVAINGNPSGADTGSETLTIENKEKKKVNLFGWSIITGWKKKFINHPIKEDFIIKGKKQKEIDSNFSSFTINNTKAEIELRYPDGDVASKVKYKKAGGIGEDEVYQKVKGGWEWKHKISNYKFQISNKNQNTTDKIQITQKNTELEVISEEIVPEIIPEDNFVEEKAFDEKKGVQLPQWELNSQSDIEILKPDPKVLGAETVRVVDDQYFFTSQIPEQQHYVIVFLGNITAGLNEKLNWLLNFF